MMRDARAGRAVTGRGVQLGPGPDCTGSLATRWAARAVLLRRLVAVSVADDRHRKGIEAYASQFGISPDEVPAWFAERFGERFGTEAINAAGGAWAPDDETLSLRDRSLIVVSALAAQGGVDARLAGHVRWAVEHGASRAELEALVTLLAVYIGYPKASAAMEVVRAELGKLDGAG